MMTREDDITVPESWQALPVERWRSPILLVGAADSGKTTFARYLYRRLLSCGERLAFVDLDPGQTIFGLPTTVGMGMGPCAGIPADTDTAQATAFPPVGQRSQVFTGSNTPVGHEPRVLTALHILTARARAQGARRVIVDTSGFVDIAYGAAALKWAKVDLLRPCTVVALQRQAELTPIIEPWRHCPDVELIVLPVSPHVRARSREARRAYRTACYRRHFANARRMPLHFGDVALYAQGPWSLHQLIALEDADGCVLSLAMIDEISEAVVWLTTPWSGPGEVAAIRMGDLGLHPTTLEDYNA